MLPTMLRRTLATLLLATPLLLVGCATQDEQLGSGPLAPVMFLAGGWHTESGEATIDEMWQPHRGELVGQNRTLRRGVLVGSELLRIFPDGDTLIYEARPNGGEATAFKMTSSGDNEVVFENPEHDWPRRIAYRLRGDVLEARLDDGSDGGRPVMFEWRRVM